MQAPTEYVFRNVYISPMIGAFSTPEAGSLATLQELAKADACEYDGSVEKALQQVQKELQGNPHYHAVVYPLDPRFESDKVYVAYTGEETMFATNNKALMKERILSCKKHPWGSPPGLWLWDDVSYVAQYTVDTVEKNPPKWTLQQFDKLE